MDEPSECKLKVLRRSLLVAAIASTLIRAAEAAEFRPFDQRAFETAQAEGRPILVHVFAPWRPTCRAQEPIVRAAATDPAFARMIIFRINYERQRQARRALNVRQQSTLIAFRGARETARSVGVTDAPQIGRLMRSAVQ